MVRELLEADSGGRGGGGGGGRGFDVSKSGDTRVGFVGFPSVGKSTLLTKLTGTHSEAAAYEASLVLLLLCYFPEYEYALLVVDVYIMNSEIKWL